MTRAGTAAVVLTARLHAPDGRPREDDDATRFLRGAAQAFSAGNPGAAGGASSVTPAGTLVLPLSSGGAVLDALLALAASLRAHRPTFCAAAACAGRTDDSRLLARGSALDRASSGLSDADPRGPRVVILAPDEDAPLGALLDLILGAHDAMTERQRQVVSLVRASGSQQAVARHLDVSRQAVNQSLAAAGWPLLSHAEGVARAHLARAAGDAPVFEL